MTEADKRKILAVEMDTLRRSCRVSRREKIRNEQIREMINVKEDFMNTKRFKYYNCLIMLYLFSDCRDRNHLNYRTKYV